MGEPELHAVHALRPRGVIVGAVSLLKGFIRRRGLLAIGVVVVAVLVVTALFVTSPSTRGRTSIRNPETGTRATVTRSALLHALATRSGSSMSAAGKALGRLTASIPAVDQPSCPTSTDPTFKTPAAQFPDGQHGLGVPFVAALTQGEILSGFHLGPAIVQKGISTKWGLSLTGISGWVTGLLEVPSLTTLVDKTTGIMFCDDRHYVPTGKATQALPRIKFTLKDDTHVADNTENYALNPKDGAYAPYFFTLEAASAPVLNVADVESDGAIDLTGSTAASTSIAIWELTGPHGSYQDDQTCVQYPGTVIDISTKSSPVPADGPAGATNQFLPSPLRGGFPSSTNDTPASATLVGNDFPVAAYVLPPNGCGFSIALDGSLSGYDKQGLDLYQPECKPPGGITDCPTIASPPGWSQFSIKATITTLDLPYGPTPGMGY